MPKVDTHQIAFTECTVNIVKIEMEVGQVKLCYRCGHRDLMENRLKRDCYLGTS